MLRTASKDQQPQQKLPILLSTEDPKASTQATTAFNQIKDPSFTSQFDDKDKGIEVKLSGTALLKDLSEHLASLEVPLGLISKLLYLPKFDALNFLLDDSGSMKLDSDLEVKDSLPSIKQRYKNSGSKYVNRWNEQEDRLYRMIEVLSFLPIKKIKINFLNRQDAIVLEHKGQTPAQFREGSLKKLQAVFNEAPGRQGTPLKTRIRDMIKQAANSEALYICTDGEPDDGINAKTEIADMIKTRHNPKMHPITFLSCTNMPEETAWMQYIDENAPFVAELDDYKSEIEQILEKQGSGIRYSRGIWLISQLVAAISPHELDKLDEFTPLSKFSLENIFGVVLTHEEYRYYLEKNLEAARKERQEAWKKPLEKRNEIHREVEKIERYYASNKWDELERIIATSQEILGIKTAAQVREDEYTFKDFPDSEVSAQKSSSRSLSSTISGLFKSAAPAPTPAPAQTQIQPKLQDEKPHRSFLKLR